ncbi:hypothetical protein BD289DRAFT_191539 [Coniella lustricola]|uniref:MutL C-terminal dimerisation domain-containing protein n=1 Tax=Coniella lustricola TaxID=2025994 RepID=A0A2T3AM09_9PEZI|nr:hypothetical protein BD289DRAFT_191539 [Coniella lustricola]
MSIRPLPDQVAAQITSSTALTSLNAVVAGLVRNALDAAASHINLTVDYARGHCCVEDDGVGIPPAEFSPDGGLAQLHFTSKFPPRPDAHGRHGVFLASVAALSLCAITSHHRGARSHNSLVLHNSTLLARHTPCAPEQRVLAFPSHGTRVAVSDLFGAMPVRVKHRALQAEKSSSFGRDWHRLVLQLVALLLAWPATVTVTMRDASARPKLVLKTGGDPRRWLHDSCRLLHQAALLSSPDASSWVPIAASAPTLRITCHVCRDPVATRRLQFMSLGIQPLSNESRCNVLYEEANRVFAESDFGLLDDSDSDATPSHADAKARKGLDRWPMFILRIDPVPSDKSGAVAVEDILDERQHNLALITDLLRAMFYQFLKQTLCRPKTVALSTGANARCQAAGSTPSRPASASTSPGSQAVREPARKAPRLESAASRPESPLAAWSNIQPGPPLQTYKTADPIFSGAQSAPAPTSRGVSQNNDAAKTDAKDATVTEEPRPSRYDAHGKLTRMPWDDCEPRRQALTEKPQGKPKPDQLAVSEPADVLTITPSQQQSEDTYERTRPVTRVVATINSRTGHVLPPKPLTLSIRASKAEPRRITRRPAANQQPPQEEPPNEIAWIRNLASKWKNPVFESAEAPTPRLPDMPDTRGRDAKPAGHRMTTMGALGRVSKQTLAKAQLIAQVDNKFILAKMPLAYDADTSQVATDPSPSSSVLVLIDQHAADERCRVEALMQDYFAPATGQDGQRYWTAVTEAPPKLLQFELSRYDGSLLGEFKHHFGYWGIHYTVHAGDNTSFGARRPDKKRGATAAAAAAETEEEEASRKTNSNKEKTKVTVHGLPPAILERCRTEPRLLAELMRKEAWRLSDEGFDVPWPRPRLVVHDAVRRKEEKGAQSERDNVPIWVSLFHGCPQGIVELIHSRSCRSAIMFNDPLTLADCSDLFTRLLRCAFPFQCAHGRPSMVPIVNLGRAGSGDGGWTETGTGTGTATAPGSNRLERGIGVVESEKADESVDKNQNENKMDRGEDFATAFKTWIKKKEKKKNKEW